MKLKELVMQTTYKEIEQAIGKAFESYGLEVTDYKKSNWVKVFDTLYAMEPEPEIDMKLRIVPGDVSGYYDEETRKKNPEYSPYMFSLTATPWSVWLGMEVDEATLHSMSQADILGNCIYEMTWWGYDEETIRKNLEERFGEKDAEDTEEDSENAEENDEEKKEVDTKTQCINFIKSFVPAVLPSITKKLGDPRFEQELVEANCQENGAYCEPIDLRPFEMPLTGIAFFYIYINGNCMMGVTTEIEDQLGEIVYNWFAPFKELKTMIEADETQKAIVDILVGQVENRLGKMSDSLLFLSDDGKKLIGVNDKSIASITIPDGVVEIGEDAFTDCRNLQIVNIPASVTKDGVMAEDAYGYKSFVFDKCTTLQQINVNSDNLELSSSDGVLFNKDKTVILFVPHDLSTTHYVVPLGVIEFGISFAYYITVEIIDIPESVEKIPMLIWHTCRALKEFNVDKENKFFSSVDGVLFNKAKTVLLKMPTQHKQICYTIPDGVVEIGNLAFRGCTELETVHIPDSVNRINDRSFNCCENLRRVIVANQKTKESIEYVLSHRSRATPPPYRGVEIEIKTIS